ncbi:MAG: tetratricopeptide repeat protein, partial [Streptosporangiaceae bacterium]
MRLDKGTYLIAAAAVAAGVLLGVLAGGLPGVLAAMAGLIPAILWQAATDRRNTTQDRATLLDQADRALVPPDVPGGVAKYLRPEKEIVTFWPRQELQSLHEWAASPLTTDIRLITGEGGVGKSRLALQLGHELDTEFGWRPYWVPSGKELSAADAACASDKPVLLVVDYAETRAQTGDLLARVIGAQSRANVRVLLLARSAGEWWQQLTSGTGAVVSETLTAVQPVVLGPLTGPSGQHDVYRQAVRAFAGELGVPCPDAAKPPALSPGAPVLVVHAAALLTVLGQEAPAAGSGTAEVIAGLLGHEARYWQQSQASYHLALGPTPTRRAVAAATLVGADDEESACHLLEALSELADPTTRSRAARWLHDLYPAAQTGPQLRDWIAPLQPDLLAEDLVTSVLRDRPQLAPSLLDGLSPQRAGRALTLLARAALTDPAVVDLISSVLAGDLPNLAVPALAVAVETNAQVGELLADLLESRHPAPDILRQIAQALPDTSIALARLGAATFQRLVDVSRPGSEERGRNLISLSNRLSDLGRREDALAAVEEAVTAYRQLAAARPDAFLPDLAMSLNNQSGRLSELGRREDALAAIEEAVTIRRQLAAARPGAFLPALATSLYKQAGVRSELGRREDALAAVEEAVTAYR